MSKIGKLKKVVEGEYLMDIGQEMTFMPLLISGAIKVFRTDNDGDDYILYFIEGGDVKMNFLFLIRMFLEPPWLIICLTLS